MPRSARDLLDEFHTSYANAYRRRPEDLAEAQSAADAIAVLDNVTRLEGLYLAAAQNALDANAAGVAGLFADAKAARADIDEAYANAKSLATKIRLVGSVVGKLQSLLEKAT